MKRPPNRQQRLKRIKKLLSVEWSLAVRERDHHRCLMCGKMDHLSAHHWLIRKGHSLALAFAIDNGATLCYGCHLGKIHRDGDGLFAMMLFDKMREIVGQDAIDNMKECAAHPAPVPLEDLEMMLADFIVNRGGA